MESIFYCGEITSTSKENLQKSVFMRLSPKKWEQDFTHRMKLSCRLLLAAAVLHTIVQVILEGAQTPQKAGIY